MNQPSPTPDTLARLRWLMEMGADELIGETPHNRCLPTAAASPKPTIHHPAAPAPLALTPTPQSSATLAAQADTLNTLRDVIERYEGSALKRPGLKTVFADGVPTAPVMVVGEGPGAEEDRQGLPFVGPSGQLLDKIAAAVGLSRQSNLYITNISPWRPPGNRAPTVEELVDLVPFVHRHIELIAPKIIILLGGSACRAVLDTSTGITRLRGQWQTVDRHAGRAVMPSFHPAYLLRRPEAKAQAWSDWLRIADKLKTME